MSVGRTVVATKKHQKHQKHEGGGVTKARKAPKARGVKVNPARVNTFLKSRILNRWLVFTLAGS